MNVIRLFLSGVLVLGVDDFTVVPLSVLNIVSGAHNGNVELTAACTNVVPVDEVNVSKFAAVYNAVLNGDGFASAEKDTAEVSVGVHAGVVIGSLTYLPNWVWIGPG